MLVQSLVINKFIFKAGYKTGTLHKTNVRKQHLDFTYSVMITYN